MSNASCMMNTGAYSDVPFHSDARTRLVTTSWRRNSVGVTHCDSVSIP